MEQGKHLASPMAPSVTNSTAMANNAIIGGFEQAKVTYIKAQERIYEEMMINFDNASKAEELVANSVGRQGYDALVMSLNDQYLTKLNDLKKKQKSKPFDISLKNEMSTLSSKFQNAIKNIEATNKMYDNHERLVAEGKLDSSLMIEGNNANLRFLRDMDEGALTIDADGNVTNTRTGEKGTFSEIVGGSIPKPIYYVDENAAITDVLKEYRAKDPLREESISEGGFLYTNKTLTPEQLAKQDTIIKSVLFNPDGSLTQVGKKWEIRRQSEAQMMNNGKAEEYSPENLVGHVKDLLSVRDERKTPLKTDSEATANQKKIADQTSEYKRRLKRGYLGQEGEVAFLTNKQLPMEIYGNDGTVYGANARITGVMDVVKPTKEGELAKYKIRIATIGEDNKLSEPKAFTLDLNNDLHRGLYNSMLKESSNQFTYANVPESKDVVGFDLLGAKERLETPDLAGVSGESQFTDKQQAAIDYTKGILEGRQDLLGAATGSNVKYELQSGKAKGVVIDGITKDLSYDKATNKLSIRVALDEKSAKFVKYLPDSDRDKREGTIVLDLNDPKDKGVALRYLSNVSGEPITTEMMNAISGTPQKQKNKYGI